MEFQIHYANSFRGSVLANQIHHVKSQILSYEDSLKAKYHHKLALLNKYLIHLEHDKQRFLQQRKQRQHSQVIEDPIIQQQEKAIEFLIKEIQLMKKQINSIQKTLITKKNYKSNTQSKSHQLKHILVQAKRKHAQLSNKHDELLNSLHQSLKSFKKQSTDEREGSCQHNNGRKSRFTNSEHNNSIEKQRQFMHALRHTKESSQMIHQCHNQLIRNEQAKEQLKRKQTLFLSANSTNKLLGKRQSSSIRTKTLSSLNNLPKLNKKQHFKHNSRLRALSLSNINLNRQKAQDEKVYLNLQKITEPIQQPLKNHQSDNTQTDLDKLIATTETVYKLQQVQQMRTKFHSMDVNQVLALIMKHQISHQVSLMIQHQKLQTVLKYSKFKKGCLIPSKINKLKL